MNELPHSIAAEQAVIGGCLLDQKAITRVDLAAAEFYRRDHRLIWETLRAMEAQTTPVDAVTFAEQAERDGVLGEIGGANYVIELSNNTPSAANVEHYAAIVRDRAKKRELVQVLIDAQREIEEGTATGEILDQTQAKLSRLTNADRSGLKTAAQLARHTVEVMERQLDGETPAIATGLRDLDALLDGGPRRGNLFVIGARPSMGKSTLACQYARNAAKKHNVLHVSLEDSQDNTTRRHIAALSKIPLNKIRNPDSLTADEWQRVSACMAHDFSALRYSLDHLPGARVEQVKALARKAHAREPIDVLIVDYLQLMTPPKADRADLAYNEISKQLKTLAVELDCCVVLLSQLNRSLEQRGNKRPHLADLRECGGLEQDADCCVFVYNDEKYNPASKDKGTVELIVAKQRDGQTGTVRVAAQLHISTFTDLAWTNSTKH